MKAPNFAVCSTPRVDLAPPVGAAATSKREEPALTNDESAKTRQGLARPHGGVDGVLGGLRGDWRAGACGPLVTVSEGFLLCRAGRSAAIVER